MSAPPRMSDLEAVARGIVAAALAAQAAAERMNRAGVDAAPARRARRRPETPEAA